MICHKQHLSNRMMKSFSFLFAFCTFLIIQTKSLLELHDNVDVWQRSTLLGLSKKYKIGKKEANMQLLYDFLHNRQTPPGTALKFRIRIYILNYRVKTN